MYKKLLGERKFQSSLEPQWRSGEAIKSKRRSNKIKKTKKMETSTEKNIANFTHLSTLTQYFIPFGNFIFPILIWTSKKDQSEYVDFHGKQTINFQLSLLLYSIVLCIIAIPILIFTLFKNIPLGELTDCHNFEFGDFYFGDNIGIITLGLISVFIFFFLKVSEFFLIVYAAIKASNGEKYKYPITIPFVK